MRSALLLLIGMLSGACTSHQNAAAAPSQTLREQNVAKLADETVALVQTTEDGELHGYCSGVWVGTNLFLTANHCVNDLELGEYAEFVVRADVLGVDASGSAHLAQLRIRDEGHDLALLRARDPIEHQTAKLSSWAPTAGDYAQTMGMPLGLWWSYSSGDIAAIRVMDFGDGPQLWVQTSAPISPGNSGCGLFDADGKLIGIAHGTFPRGQNLNLFVHPLYINDFLALAGLA
jgi:serine protease Do